MKTQFPITKYGFTMIEILLVISILGFLFYTLGRTNFRPQENLNKAERLGNRISGVLHDALLFTALGRMDKGTAPQAITGATVTISTSTGISWYYSPTFSGSYGSGIAFFDGDLKYRITDIIWS
jgi:prepilin-type N-terminal cleavage/methylation domain-containing protein